MIFLKKNSKLLFQLAPKKKNSKLVSQRAPKQKNAKLVPQRAPKQKNAKRKKIIITRLGYFGSKHPFSRF